MKLSKELKEFLNEPENQELLNIYKFKDIYDELYLELNRILVSEFTQLCLESGINSLKYMDEVPIGYLYGSNIKSFNIPNNVKKINMYAFSECRSLTNVTIPNSVTSIENDTFSRCDSLTNVTIPNSVIDIGSHAFWGCSSLTSVTIPDNVTSIENDTFDNCKNLTNVTIGKNVTSIGNYAFSRCSSLTNIIIPNSVKNIRAYAFDSCSSLTNITFNGTMAEWKVILKEWFWNNGVPQSCKIHCIDGIIGLNENLSVNKNLKEDYSKDTSLKIKLDNKYVGKALLRDYQDGEIFLTDFEIKPEYRGKGYGKKSFDMLVNKYGVNSLTVNPENSIALNLYKKFGFEQEGEPYFDSNSNETVIYMKRRF